MVQLNLFHCSIEIEALAVMESALSMLNSRSGASNLLPNCLQTIHANGSLAQSRDTETMTQPFRWIRNIVVRDRRVSRNSVIPKRNSLVIPLKADLQILTVGDMLLLSASAFNPSPHPTSSTQPIIPRKRKSHNLQ